MQPRSSDSSATRRFVIARQRVRARRGLVIEKTGSIPEASTPEALATILGQMREETAAAVKAFGLERD
jgi:hypothetical protein